ncbi:MAG: hypothetical protein DRP11_00530 [Candidatus Aenigmatarchaeota archaeon]|nr:MAG: hypothetical protein DRP11_00530 [Candidatus Aenigmarchaeota archaeon]
MESENYLSTPVGRDVFHKTKNIVNELKRKRVKLYIEPGAEPCYDHKRQAIFLPHEKPLTLKTYTLLEHELSHVLFDSKDPDSAVRRILEVFGFPYNSRNYVPIFIALNAFEDERVESLWGRIYRGTARRFRILRKTFFEELKITEDPVGALLNAFVGEPPIYDSSKYLDAYNDAVKLFEQVRYTTYEGAVICTKLFVEKHLLPYLKKYDEIRECFVSASEKAQEFRDQYFREFFSNPMKAAKQAEKTVAEIQEIMEKIQDKLNGAEMPDEEKRELEELYENALKLLKEAESKIERCEDTGRFDIREFALMQKTFENAARILSAAVPEHGENARKYLREEFEEMSNRDLEKLEDVVHLEGKELQDRLEHERKAAETYLKWLEKRLSAPKFRVVKNRVPEVKGFVNVRNSVEGETDVLKLLPCYRQLHRFWEKLRGRLVEVRDEEGLEVDLDDYIQFKVRKTGEPFVTEDVGPGMAIAIGVDCSGSMDGWNIQYAKDILYTLWKSLEPLKKYVDLEVYAWRQEDTSKFSIDVQRCKKPEDVAKLYADGYTPTPLAVQYGVHILSRKRHPKKLLIIITDGKPQSFSTKGRLGTLWLVKETRKTVLEAARKGISVVGIYVNVARDPYPQKLMEEMFPNRHVVVKDFDEVGKVLTRYLTKLIMREVHAG